MKISKFLPLIGIVLFIYLLNTIDLFKVWDILTQINAELFILSFLVLLSTLFFKGLKWMVIIRSYGTSFPLKESIKGWMVGFSIGLITPGKIGDFARSYYLKEKENLGKSLTTVMADRIIDIIVLFLLSIIGLSYFVSNFMSNDFLLVSTYLLFIAFIFVMVLLTRKNLTMRMVKPFVRFLPKSKQSKIKLIFHDFYEGVDSILKKKKLLVTSFLITIIIWVVTIVYVFLLALALNLEISYFYLFMIYPIVSLVLVLPISFSGIGTRDASMIFFLSFIAILPEAAISLSLMILFLDYVLGLIGAYFWYRDPIKLEKINFSTLPLSNQQSDGQSHHHRKDLPSS